MNELLQPILALGGIGYINYLFYERISDRNFGTDTDKKFFVGAMTSINYFLYLISRLFINEMIPSLILSIAFSALLTLCLPWLVNKSFWFTNKIREEKDMINQEEKKVFDISFGSNKPKALFIFSLSDNQLISAGYARNFSGEFENFSIRLSQFWGEDNLTKLQTEKDIHDYVYEKNIGADIYINIDKKIKIVYFELE